MITLAKALLFNSNNPLGFASSSLGSELLKTKNVLKAQYDFAELGGAVGTVKLLDQEGRFAVLPDNAIITKVLFEVITAPTSGGAAEIAFDSEGAGDLKAAAVLAGFTLGAFLDGIPANTAATAIKLSADRNITMTITVAALTAGKINVFIEYLLSE